MQPVDRDAIFHIFLVILIRYPLEWSRNPNSNIDVFRLVSVSLGKRIKTSKCPRAFARLLRGERSEKGEDDCGDSAEFLFRGGTDVPSFKVPHLEKRRHDVFRSGGALRVGRIHVS